MLQFHPALIAEYIGGICTCPETERIVEGVAIDSRHVKGNDLFFALKGDQTDGHRFLAQAVQNGASAVVVSKAAEHCDVCQIVVKDTFKALQLLAKKYVSFFDIPFVAITGSSGKTTTKDIVASVLAQKYNVLKTQGNLNSTTGVPLTLFDLTHEHEIAVIEMSMSHPNEILENAEIVRPKTAVITNIGFCHVEFLGTQENIFRAKTEVLAYLTERDTAIMNADDPFLARVETGEYNLINVGIEQGTFRAEEIVNRSDAVSFCVKIEGVKEKFSFPVPGNHNVINSLFGIAVGLQYGLTPDQIRRGLQLYAPSKHRMEIVKTDQVTLINDTYNANPDAMDAAVDVLGYLSEDSRKIAVLCDMYELGCESEQSHVRCGKYAAQQHVDLLLTYGTYAEQYKQGFSQGGDRRNCIVFETLEALETYLIRSLQPQDTILFKASRGVHLETVFLHLKEKFFDE